MKLFILIIGFIATGGQYQEHVIEVKSPSECLYISSSLSILEKWSSINGRMSRDDWSKKFKCKLISGL